ncbi:MAG: chemotaxis protein MotB [Planctomycetota bacterium]|jgi:chemotaxis protein MotB
MQTITTGLGLVAVVGLNSCVSTERFEASQDETKHYQRAHHDLEQYQTELEAEVESLRAQVNLRDEGAPVDATFTQPIDDRLAELRRMEQRIAGIGTEQGDVTVVSFDGGFGYSLRDSVLFDSGSANIQPAGLKILKALALDIKTQKFDRVWVRGHTDSDPIKKAETLRKFPNGNLQLSAMRAIEVASILVRGGVNSKQVVIAGFGPNESVVPNTSAGNKGKNRRVEIFIEQADGASGR